MKEQPREKLERLGLSGLRDNELLALMLRTGYKGKSVFELADEILKKYNKKNKSLFELSYKELSKIKGIGKSKAAIILAGYEFARRALSKPARVVISDPEDAVNQITEIRSRKKENFVVLYLNARNELIHKEFISIGTLDASLVHPREVFAPAIEYRAIGVVLTHNHPSGNVNPSDDDLELTKRIVESGRILGIEVFDHIIVTETDYFSLKENDLLSF
ncbi:MAG: DNA repair protein RadC [Elusimicrobiota bacterium]|nr:DNA repair protein RadC [Elusimicrobiota bacterium]